MRSSPIESATRTRSRGLAVRSISSRRVFVAGVLIAVIGIPFFFGGRFEAQLIGTGLISLGAGIALSMIARRAAVDSVTAARSSKAGAVGALILAPHTIAFGVLGLGLIGFGLLVLAIAVGIL